MFFIWYLLFKPQANQVASSTKAELVKALTKPVQLPQFLGLSLGIILIAFNIFLYGTFSYSSTPVLGLGLFNLFSLLAILLSFKRERLSPLVATIVAVSVFAGIMLPLRANGFVQSVNGFFILANLTLLVFINSYTEIHWLVLWVIKSLLRLVPASLNQTLLLASQPKSNQQFSLISLFKTIVITLIVLIVFAGILSQADPIFAQIIKEFREEAIGRTIASLVIAFFFAVFATINLKSPQENRLALKFLSFADVFIPVTAVIALIGLFIVIQVKYLFGSHADFSSFDLTYSEYVRKGFLELLTASFFGGLIALLVILKNKVFTASRQVLQLKVINTILIGELFFLLASAFKRDLMYVEVYGLTRVRVAGGIFLLWLAGILLMLMIMTVYKQLTEKKFFIGLFAMSVAVVLALNLINMDQIIATGQPGHHDYQDYFYLNNLSTDGVQAWEESIPQIEQDLQYLLAKNELSDAEKSQLAGDKLALISLQEQRTKLYRKYLSEVELIAHCEEFKCLVPYSPADKNKASGIGERLKTIRNWQHLSFSERAAYKQIADNRQLFFEQVDTLLQQIETYQIAFELDLYVQENRLLNEFNYPFIEIKLDYYPHPANFTPPAPAQ